MISSGRSPPWRSGHLPGASAICSLQCAIARQVEPPALVGHQRRADLDDDAAGRSFIGARRPRRWSSPSSLPIARPADRGSASRSKRTSSGRVSAPAGRGRTRRSHSRARDSLRRSARRSRTPGLASPGRSTRSSPNLLRARRDRSCRACSAPASAASRRAPGRTCAVPRRSPSPPLTGSAIGIERERRPPGAAAAACAAGGAGSGAPARRLRTRLRSGRGCRRPRSSSTPRSGPRRGSDAGW